MGGGLSRFEDTDWNSATGQLQSPQDTIDGKSPTCDYGIYYLIKRGAMNQREYYITDAQSTLLYTTRAVPGTLAWFDVLSVDDNDGQEYFILRIQVDLSRRYWNVFRYNVPSFPGQFADKQATEKLAIDRSAALQKNNNNKRHNNDSSSSSSPFLYRKCCITVSWSRYMAVAVDYGPPPPPTVTTNNNQCRNSSGELIQFDDQNDMELFVKAKQAAERMQLQGSASTSSSTEEDEDEQPVVADLLGLEEYSSGEEKKVEQQQGWDENKNTSNNVNNDTKSFNNTNDNFMSTKQQKEVTTNIPGKIPYNNLSEALTYCSRSVNSAVNGRSSNSNSKNFPRLRSWLGSTSSSSSSSDAPTHQDMVNSTPTSTPVRCNNNTSNTLFMTPMSNNNNMSGKKLMDAIMTSSRKMRSGSNLSTPKNLTGDPLEGVLNLDPHDNTKPLLLCQEIYNKFIGNHQTSLLTKQQAIKLFKKDMEQHYLQHKKKVGHDDYGNHQPNSNDIINQQNDDNSLMLLLDQDVQLLQCIKEKETGSNPNKDSDAHVDLIALSPSVPTQQQHDDNSTGNEMSRDGKNNTTTIGNNNNNRKHNGENKNDNPLVGYWAWENSLRTHKMKMHVAKNTDLALHIVMAIIVNQVRCERHAIAMTV